MERARLHTPLKAAMEHDGRRQSWLADRLGVTPPMVWGWVHGLHIPTDNYQRQIAVALQRPQHELFPPDLSVAA